MSLGKRIAERSYQLFLKRGGKHGYHQQDWLQAEKEIRAEMKGATVTPKKEVAKTAAKPAVKAAAKPKKAAKAAKKSKK